MKLLVLALGLASTGCVFSNVRSAVVSPGLSFAAQGAMTTDVGPEVGWFFGDECSPCDGPVPSVDGTLQYGSVPTAPNGRAFTIGLGVSGLFMPYAEGYMQLSRSAAMPYGAGVRIGVLGPWRQAQIFGRLDRPLGPGRRLLWNPSLFYHGGDRNGQIPGYIVALVNGIGLELSRGWVAVTPSLSLVASHAERNPQFQAPTSDTRVFGAAAVGLAIRRDPYR
jgi:hypothetical protein